MTVAGDHQNSRKIAVPSLVIGSLVILLLLIRARSWHDPPEWDTGTYITIANELNHGRSLYTDIWDMKPPGIFYTYALAMRLGNFGPGDWRPLLFGLSIVTALMTLAGVWLVAELVSPAAALWASAFWVALCFEPFTAANQPNCESFMNAFTAIGSALLLRIHLRSTQAPRWMIGCTIAGLCFGFATLYKPLCVAPAAGLAIAHVAMRPPQRRRGAIVQSLTILLCIAFVWLALFGWFALTHRGEMLWETVVTYSRYYAGNPLRNLLHGFTFAAWIDAPLRVLWPVALLSAVAIVAELRHPEPQRSVHRRIAVMLGVMLLGSWIAVASPGHWARHYFQLLFPILAIGGGIGAAWLIARGWLTGALVLVALAAVFWPQVEWLEVDGSQWPRLRYADPTKFFATRDDFIAATRSIPLDRPVYVWGDEPWLYVITARRCPYAALWRMHAMEGPVAEELTARTIRQFESNPPALIACFGGPWPAEHPIMRWMLDRYERVPGTNAFPMQFFRPRNR